MNRLKLSNRLIHSSHRSACSLSPFVRSLDLKNVNTARCRQNISTPFTAKKFAFSSSNKISGFGVFDSRFRQSFPPAAAPNFGFSVRRFSDLANPADPSLPVTSIVQLNGIWKDLAECAVVEFCQNGFVSLHLATGLPWWATIVLSTWAIRATVTLPLAIFQNANTAKVMNLKEEMNDIVRDLKLEAQQAMHKFQWSPDYTQQIYRRSVTKQWNKLIQRDNCHPMKGLVLGMVQIPMWIVLTTALRNLCYMLPNPTGRAQMIYVELTNGGFGWITNLAACDPYYVMPIALGLLNLTIIEMQLLMSTIQPNKKTRYITNGMRILTIVIVPLASMMPAGVTLYWASSSAFGVVQNLTLMSPRVRRLVGIPQTDEEHEEPYRLLYTKLRQRIGLDATPSPKPRTNL